MEVDSDSDSNILCTSECKKKVKNKNLFNTVRIYSMENGNINEIKCRSAHVNNKQCHNAEQREIEVKRYTLYIYIVA